MRDSGWFEAYENVQQQSMKAARFASTRTAAPSLTAAAAAGAESDRQIRSEGGENSQDVVTEVYKEPNMAVAIVMDISNTMKEDFGGKSRYAAAMTAADIDGHGYIGFLGIPSLELELPVMADWTYPQLQIAPCRYSGSTFSNDLVIMAQNYPKHFGKLRDMHTGDVVTFTDMEGETLQYQVIALEVLGAAAVEEMTAGEYDLTLFACTYGGENRVTLRCDRVRY